MYWLICAENNSLANVDFSTAGNCASAGLICIM